MSKGIVIKVTGTLLLLASIFSEGYPQDGGTHSIRLMFYNVENFFDTSDDPVTDDNEFLPQGVRRWTYRRYSAKVSSIYRTIVAAGGWEAPAIVGLCEVENRKVMEDLILKTNLSKYRYSIIHEDSPDPRGIDVCLLYREDLVTVLCYKYFNPPDTGSVHFTSRSLLYAKFMISGDTVHLFINHWPSRRGGVLAGEQLRKTMAQTLREKADSVTISRGGNSYVIFAGDFNAAPGDEVTSSLTDEYISGLTMVNLSELITEETGTYRYRGIWEMIDQVMVSQHFLGGSGILGVEPTSLRIFRPAFLLVDDPSYPGPSPFSTYRGFRYQGGYSDHLPVLLDITSRKPF